jgi:hypothetical protein
MPRLFTLEVLFCLFVAIAISVLRYIADRRHIHELKQRANAALAAVNVDAQDPRFRLVGSEAIVEKKEEVGGARGLFERVADYSVTACLVNQHGERFLVKWHSKSKTAPFIKHLAASASRLVRQ